MSFNGEMMGCMLGGVEQRHEPGAFSSRGERDLEANPRLEIMYLPAGAPDLNPQEQVRVVWVPLAVADGLVRGFDVDRFC